MVLSRTAVPQPSYAGMKLEWGKSIDADNCLVALSVAEEEKMKKASQTQKELALAATKAREAEVAAKQSCLAAEKVLGRAIAAKEVEANKTLAAHKRGADSMASMKDAEEELRTVVLKSSTVQRQGEQVKLMAARAVAALSASMRTSLGASTSEGDDVLKPVVEDRHRPLDSVERYGNSTCGLDGCVVAVGCTAALCQCHECSVGRDVNFCGIGMPGL